MVRVAHVVASVGVQPRAHLWLRNADALYLFLTHLAERHTALALCVVRLLVGLEH